MRDAAGANMPARALHASPQEFPGAAAYLPRAHSLAVLRDAVQSCRGCPLYKRATQAVFGEGRKRSRVMLIGEVPGDKEDIAGHVFVGPAGKLLDEALAHAGIPRAEAYLTNAVKHFKFTQRGKRRIHDKPNRYEIAACKPWLDEELLAVKPEIVVLLGATAAQALLGNSFRVTKSRGQLLDSDLAKYTIATVHPASVLRAPDAETRAEQRAAFLADLTVAGKVFAKLG